jgi:hypothetical protein
MTSPGTGLNSTPAGWYRDPADLRLLRYWDGTVWSDQVRPAEPIAAPAAPANTGNGLAIAAIVLGAIAVLFVPILFGGVGIALGAVAMSKQQPLARWGLGVAIAGTIVGMILGALVGMSTI